MGSAEQIGRPGASGLLAAVGGLALVCRLAAPIPPVAVDVPEGFKVELFAADIPNARSLALGAHGTVFVGTKQDGRVYAISDPDRDGRPDGRYVLASGLYMPNGVAFHGGALYVAEVNRIIRFDDVESRLDDPAPPAVVRDDLPSDPGHGWRYLARGPDGDLYLSVGAPCNACQPVDWRLGTILRMKPDGSNLEAYARGVRNSVGLDWHPVTGELWFTDNGRDILGDDVPPDELNRATGPGLHFGFPFCHGSAVIDPEEGTPDSCRGHVPPVAELGAHVAALGTRFYTGRQFPAPYHDQVFVAEHGSWNRSSPSGYRVTLVRMTAESAVRYEPFATGWLRGGHAWGRPTDLLVLPDGSMLVSDDLAGRIYRISYDAGRPPA